MADKPFLPVRILLAVTLSLAVLAAFIPLKPPGKIWISAAEAGALAVFMLCLSLYDAIWRTSYRPAIPMTWLTLSAGLGCMSMALMTMARSWGLRREQMPFTQVSQWFGAGMVLLLLGSTGFFFAAQKRRLMYLANSDNHEN